MPDAVYEDTVTFPVSIFPKDCDFISIDKGCSLTKACIGKRDGDSVKFACRTYQNTDLDSVFDWLAADGNVQHSTRVKVTGVGGDLIRQSAAERLNCKTAFVDEFRAQKSGAELLFLHGVEEEIFYPDPTLRFESKMSSDSDVWKQFADDLEGTAPSTATLFMYIGSATGFTWIGTDDDKPVGGGSFIGGKSFLGLCNLLLDTRDFSEIAELAKKGDRSKVDLLGSDVFKDCQESSYTAFPSDMSIFHFGKLVDGLTSKEQLSRADKAAAIVGFYSELFRTLIQIVITGRKCRRIVIGGNLGRCEYFREDCYSGHLATALFHGGTPLRFLRTGHTAALGALVEEPLPK